MNSQQDLMSHLQLKAHRETLGLLNNCALEHLTIQDSLWNMNQILCPPKNVYWKILAYFDWVQPCLASPNWTEINEEMSYISSKKYTVSQHL